MFDKAIYNIHQSNMAYNFLHYGRYKTSFKDLQMYSRDLKNCQKHPCFYKKRIEGFTVEITIPVMLASSYDVRKERFFPETKNYIHKPF